MKLIFQHGVPVWNPRCSEGPDGKPCQECRDASRAVRREKRERRRAWITLDPNIRRHGSATTYQSWGCTCDACRAAGTAKRYKYPRGGKGKGVPFHKGGKVSASATPPFGREWLNDV